MRWLTFSILACVAIVLQTALSWRLQLGPIRPEWVIVLAGFYALHAPASEAVTAGWILGLVLDLSSDARLGLFALSFAVAALVVVRFREVFFRNHVLSHASVTFAFAGIVHGIVGIYRMRAFPGIGSGWSVMVWEPMLTALYAAAWAVPAFYLLRGLSPWMGLRLGRARRV